ncbi:MAG TPA: hypothetical protein VN806_14860 [Caulobacteraceae bacterium]|nr:hypothetical protein [Caulobacteraceae bacterium]
MSDPGPSRGGGVALFLGWMLIVIGGLLGGLSGLCTLVFITVGIATNASTGEGLTDVVLAVVVGALPIGIGAGITLAGVTVVRATRQAHPAAPPKRG